MKRNNSNFFQPIISFIGLIISLITAVLPLFSRELLSNFFIDKELAGPFSFISFILGIIIIWQVIEKPIYNIPLGKLKDRGRGVPEYRKIYEVSALIWLLSVFILLFGLTFIYLSKNNVSLSYNLQPFLQGFIYLLFFISLISVFSILFSQTKRRFDWENERENIPITLFETLEKNRLIKPGIEIYENRQMSNEEILNEKITGQFFARKIKVCTQPQKKETIEFITTSDAKEIIKILKKQEEE